MLYVVSCEDADSLFVVDAGSKSEANKVVVKEIKDWADAIEESEAVGDACDAPASILRIIDLRNSMKRKVRFGALLKSEPQLQLSQSLYSLTDD